MKQLSTAILAEKVTSLRKEKKIQQEELSKLTGINRTMIGRIEHQTYIPSLPQLMKLAEAHKPTTNLKAKRDIRKRTT